ncbi:hypothetical protein [Streptosporangium sp. LJ11]|uniref:hypothetical protein n=1 Tax=Streptosporangium sp. LJ11 TaxID=3436927 RepID=UPI003F78B044
MPAAYRRVPADLGLTCPQYLVMMALWEREPVSPPAEVLDLQRTLRRVIAFLDEPAR